MVLGGSYCRVEKSVMGGRTGSLARDGGDMASFKGLVLVVGNKTGGIEQCDSWCHERPTGPGDNPDIRVYLVGALVQEKTLSGSVHWHHRILCRVAARWFC